MFSAMTNARVQRANRYLSHPSVFSMVLTLIVGLLIVILSILNRFIQPKTPLLLTLNSFVHCRTGCSSDYGLLSDCTCAIRSYYRWRVLVSCIVCLTEKIVIFMSSIKVHTA